MNHYSTSTIKTTGKAREYVSAAMGILNARGSLVRMIVDDLLADREAFREAFREACQDAYEHADKGKLLGTLRASLNNAYKVMNDETGKAWLATVPQYGVQTKDGKVAIGLAKTRNTTSNWVKTKATEKLAETIAATGVDANAVSVAKFLAMAGFTAADMEAIADIMENEGEDGSDE